MSYHQHDDYEAGSIVSGYGYKGEYTESNLQYLRFRYLDTDSGRFISRDSYLGNEDPISPNRYTYVNNNPFNHGDPIGYFLSGIVKGIKKAVNNVVKTVVDVGKKVVNKVVGGVKKIISGTKKIVQSAVDFVGDSYNAITGKQKIVPEITAQNNYSQQVVEQANTSENIVTLQSMVSDYIEAGASPEEIRALIQAYCEIHGLDPLTHGKYLEELTRQTYEKQQAELWNSQGALERIASSAKKNGLKALTGYGEYLSGVGDILVVGIAGVTIVVGGVMLFSGVGTPLAVTLFGLAAELSLATMASSLVASGIGFTVSTIGDITGNAYYKTKGLEIAGDSLENAALASMLYVIASTGQSINEDAKSKENNEFNTSKEAEQTQGSGKVKAEDIKFTDKFNDPKYAKQPSQRGWTNQKIADTINNPVKVGDSINTYTGNPVKVYYIDDIHYVAVDTVTNKVVQVADLGDNKWVFDLLK